MEQPDIKNFTTEQLRAALALKEKDGAKICCFIPKRAGQVPCDGVAVVFFGELCYCKSHKRTVQAMNAKKAFEEANASTEMPEKQEKEASVPLETIVSETTTVETTVETTAEAKTEEPVSATDPLPVTTAIVTETPKNSDNLQENSRFTESFETKVPASIDADRRKLSSFEDKVDVVPKEKLPVVKKSFKSRLPPPTIVKRVIKPNRWGRFEDTETGILFDPKSKAAYGVQDRRTGKVLPLGPKDIETCKRYKWNYHIIKDNSSTDEDDSERSDQEEDEQEEDDQEDEDDDQKEDDQEEEEDDQEDEDDDQKEDDQEEEDEDDQEDEDDDSDENDDQEEDEDDDSDENEEDDQEEEQEVKPKSILKKRSSYI